MQSVKRPTQRVGVFIDTQNLYHSAKNLYQARVNFKKVLEKAVAGRQLIRAFAYVVTTESKEEQAFLDALENMGIEIRSKELLTFFGGVKKADWDVGMSVDAIVSAPKLDAVVLATGDGDFVPLVEYLRIKEGCRVEAIAFGKSSSSKLKEAVDEFIDMDKNRKSFLINKN